MPKLQRSTAVGGIPSFWTVSSATEISMRSATKPPFDEVSELGDVYFTCKNNHDLASGGNTCDFLLKRKEKETRLKCLETLIEASQVLITGAKDRAVPPKYGKEYEAAARKSGDSVESIEVENAGHFEVIAPASSAWSTVERAVLSLLDVKK